MKYPIWYVLKCPQCEGLMSGRKMSRGNNAEFVSARCDDCSTAYSFTDMEAAKALVVSGPFAKQPAAQPSAPAPASKPNAEPETKVAAPQTTVPGPSPRQNIPFWRR